MKHFFSVPGIAFVLSIDKNHLASAVRGFYGTENINTDEYLRRFIDLEYSIPRPQSNVSCKYLFQYYSFDEFFLSPERRQYQELQNDAEFLLIMARTLLSNATLRQQEKIFGQTRLILNSFKPNQYTFSHFLFVLIFMKTMHNELFRKIENGELTLQEVSDAFADLLPASEVKRQRDLNFIHVQALLLHFYNNSQEYHSRTPLIEGDTEGNATSTIESRLASDGGKKALAIEFARLNQRFIHQDISLKYLLDKINLIDPLILR